MKIIQLIYNLGPGGAEVFVVNLSNALAKLGHDVTICMLLDRVDSSREFREKNIATNVKFHSMRFTKGFSVGKMLKLCSYIRSENPDIVHGHLNLIPYFMPEAFYNKKIKFFHTIHSVVENASGNKSQYLFNKYFYKTGKIRPITISSLCSDSYVKYYNLDNDICIDNGTFPVEKTLSFETVREEIDFIKGNEKDSLIFIHVARYHPQKNQKLLIEAFNRLNEKGIKYHLLVLGKWESDEAEILKSKACKRIHFLGVKKPNDYLFCSDAFCLTSIYEGLPISLLEAVSVGVVPICTPVGGIPEIVKDKQTGFLSTDLTVEAYLEAIDSYMGEIKKGVNFDNLKNIFKEKYSMDICVNKYLGEYNK